MKPCAAAPQSKHNLAAMIQMTSIESPECLLYERLGAACSLLELCPSFPCIFAQLDSTPSDRARSRCSTPVSGRIMSCLDCSLPPVFVFGRKKHYPRPYPGILHNAHSASRMAGDLPDLIPAIKLTKANSEAIFSITTQKLGSPIAQLLLPGNRMIILDEPREIEDILNRRGKQFNKSA
ncbi:hypothetical protein QBC36DRAFT_340674 [Triangularia setosa]|uniref:Uncharacterized protein n=1 Tax=Triangularia setosa TaxID=2587417 RepID=A0AAN7A0R7_9PEZI|nr:hypothetical protein QBC36DRAFT_340674 [Podospora setosa]